MRWEQKVEAQHTTRERAQWYLSVLRSTPDQQGPMLLEGRLFEKRS